ncbi:hypothetical protein MINTM019_52150 [Mycobacterium paraintracellulare]|nr:hypothetical protein MINTM019_52150 [Mycobacterium paraintracellulare]BCP12947.1 hypothetical protein MINTM020_50450 [Mycobacterium paraintracellulare]
MQRTPLADGRLRPATPTLRRWRRPAAPGYAALAIATQTAVRRAMERNGIGSQPGRCRAS